jgi:hypothetical protein
VDETRGTVGRTRLSQILRGGRSRALQTANHHKLPSHGALVHLTEPEVLATIDAMIGDGLLEKTDGRYPLVRRARS